MFKIVVLLALLPRLPHQITTLLACTPNTQFLLNGRLCFCDNRGHLNEANCRKISRRQFCQPGQIIWQGCNQCICQESGYLVCSNAHCSDGFRPTVLRQGLSIFGLRCTPFMSYYINCSLCVCPASGNTNEANCVNDVSCNPKNNGIQIVSNNKIYCIPNVMYISPCKQCLCPEHGYFDKNSCIEKCIDTAALSVSIKHCLPETLYRSGCQICRCPKNSLADDSLCINATCNNSSLHDLRSGVRDCFPYSFTFPRCLYCDCNSKGFVDENACLEIDCTNANQLGKQKTSKDTCIPGEILPICIECFCARDGQSIAKYCSRLCSYQDKLNILEVVLRDASDFNLIDKSEIKKVKDNEQCSPNSLYLDNNIYCFCPENGNTNLKLCTSVSEDLRHSENKAVLSNNVEIDYNTPCEPNTFIEFDCNTCYCTKNGKIDPKWCTYDDCQAKRLIQESYKTQNIAVETEGSGTCRPGVISKLKCNFCICSESGILKEKTCTHNNCTEIDHKTYNDKLTCEPLVYYEVDCNICYCPRDGIKNVAKCTKNLCEKNTLRSESCTPGELFSDACNLCVCPPDGNKMGKVCTNHVCPHKVTEKLLQFPDDLRENHVTKRLDHCFLGEEFVDGCKFCICPDLGLKMYATCESILCDEVKTNEKHKRTTKKIHKTLSMGYIRSRRKTDCHVYNISLSAERKECTPGTVYIIRCKECICPYFGNINHFCRPLAKNKFCEQAFPYFNYVPMGRRGLKGENTNADTKAIMNTSNNETYTNLKSNKTVQIKINHDKHTEFKCDKLGTIMDKCFICDCEKGNVLIEEHCFKSDADDCANARPTFLFKHKVDLR